MSYNDCILEGVQKFKMEHKEIDIYIYSPESLLEAEKIFSDGSNDRKAKFRCCLFWVAAIMSQWQNFIGGARLDTQQKYPAF